jgi:hypothetical protein
MAISPELQAVIDQANLRPEQAAIFKLLMALQGAPGAAGAQVVDVEPEPARAPVSGTSLRRLRHLKRELADLREVNDTVAAALGACRVCWGGDEECHECEGDGRPGSRRPDPVMFDRLVVPAVRRARTARGEPGR